MLYIPCVFFSKYPNKGDCLTINTITFIGSNLCIRYACCIFSALTEIYNIYNIC